jgi:dolichyl-phosphate-mannose-protein mannosyltransferase
MEKMMRLLYRVGRWQYAGLCLLVLVVVALHFSVVDQPHLLVFDEQHYVPDALSIIEGSGTSISEHPPLGKLFIALGIFLFGDTPLGWRFFSIVFGIAGIVLFYFICRQLQMPPRASFLATFLLALSNMSFVQASVAMLDVYCLTFMLGCFYLYLRGRYLPSGISLGLSALSKISGALGFISIFLHWLVRKRKSPARFYGLMLIAVASFVLLMPLFDFIAFGHLVSPVERIKDILSLSGSLTFANTSHVALSHPWDWVLRPEMMYYWYEPRYIGAISFTIWIMIIPVLIYMIFRARRGDDASLFGLCWFAGTYLVWIPMSLISDRISFVYYFYPTIGAICIGLGLGLSHLLDIWRARREGKLRWVAGLAVPVYLASHLTIFVILSPVFARWIPLPFADIFAP